MATDLRALLSSLKLYYLAANIDDLIGEATRNRWGPQELFDAVVKRELEERQRRSVERRLRDAHIGRFRPMASFDWAWPKLIDREHIERLLSLEFLNEHENVILAAAQGLGKTMIAKNIAYKAILAGHTVLFTTAGTMLLDLSQQDGPRALQTRLRRYTAPRLLVVDEVGYLSYDTRAADLLFEIVTRRYEAGSIVLTTNLSFKDWPHHFPGAGCVTAMIDRLTHHAEIVSFEGESYRLREAEERQKSKRQARKP